MARVGVDIDGVLYPFEEELRKALLRNGKRFYRYEMPPATRWEFYEDWRMTRECFVDYCNQFTNSGDLFREGAPYPGVGIQLARLQSAGHTIVLITNRNFGREGVIREATEAWLRAHLIPYDELHFVEDKTEIDVDYHIDDNVDNVRAMSAHAKAFLCDRPWNQDVAALSLNAYRGTLEQYVDKILDREQPPCSGESPCPQHGPVFHTPTEIDFEEADEAAGVPTIGDVVARVLRPGDGGEVRVTSSTGGQKGKKLARFSLIPAEALWEVAEHYGKGAEKYDDHNWRKGYDWSLSMDALERHWNLFRQGQDIDPETGSHHLCGVVFHALSLMTFGREHPEFDDRFKTPASSPTSAE